MQVPRPESDQYAKPDDRTKSRRCLHCGRMFESYHAGNRICRRCTNLNDFQNKLSGPPEHGIIK